jgi:hypothetical protein
MVTGQRFAGWTGGPQRVRRARRDAPLLPNGWSDTLSHHNLSYRSTLKMDHSSREHLTTAAWWRAEA